MLVVLSNGCGYEELSKIIEVNKQLLY